MTRIRKAAVLGAGVMGAQIAAHLVNAEVPTLLFELPADGPTPNDNVLRAIANLEKLQPAPLVSPARAGFIQPANYRHDLPLLRDCDLVIEAISERMDWKIDLFRKVAPHLGDRTVLVTNTSGLSVNELAGILPAGQRPRFCGVHFFNPPRYMHLVEIIPAGDTAPEVLDGLESFLVTRLGKGVIRALDTPNFIANRVGVFSMLATLHHAARLGLAPDVVDALTGTLIGHPKSATFRTADIVGLDTFAHVVSTMETQLASDPWCAYYRVPGWMQQLIREGALGQKSGRGIYRKVGRAIEVYDASLQSYRPAEGRADEEVIDILKYDDPAVRIEALRSSSHQQAQFLWSVYRDTFHYCAFHLADIARNARDVDLALRWGFGWAEGPFETWQSGGWSRIAGWLAEDIARARTMAPAPLPEWATAPQRQGVHSDAGSFAPASGTNEARSSLPVYRRQEFPDRVVGETAARGVTLFENSGVRCWQTGDDVAIVSFKSRMHAIGADVLEGVLHSIEIAEERCRGLVIWQTEAPFSVGANLKKSAPAGPRRKPSVVGKALKAIRREAESLALSAARHIGVGDLLMAGRLAEVEAVVRRFQDTTARLRYSSIPTVAAVDGLALGGGCEFVMHCDRAVATMESYIGLVEVGVGLLPAGGGCKEFALRAASAHDGDIRSLVQKYFKTVATAEVSRSAELARQAGYLREADLIVMNRFELLHAAKAQILALDGAGYRPPLHPVAIPVAGRSAIATIRAYMTNMREGGYISDHDLLIGLRIAEIMCGGDVEPGSLVDEEWFLEMERRYFMELIATEKSQARIDHMLKTGKPLRN